MKALGHNSSEKDIEEIYEEFDTDKNGKIDFNGKRYIFLDENIYEMFKFYLF